MTEYKIVTSPDTDNVQTEVNKLLTDNWQIRGDLILSKSQNGIHLFSQAMVKE